MKKTDVVAVLMGGPSAEAEISRLTGTAIASALREKEYRVLELELNPARLAEDLRAHDVKVVFNAVHGKYGEDGRLQSMLEALSMPYTGSGVLASAVAMDKIATKRFLVSAGVATPDYLILQKDDAPLEELMEKILAKFSLPVVVKAAEQGSSIGVAVARSNSELRRALEDAFSYGANILVEKCIVGKELTVAVMQEAGAVKPLPVIMIVPHSGAYDYHSKYTKGATDYLVPAPLSEEVTARVQSLAAATYSVLGCRGVARIDMMLDEDGNAYVLEANTVPGMTATSLVPKAAAAVGMSFADLCEKILLAAE